MPKMLVDIPDTEITYIRPAILSVINDLIERTRAPRPDMIHFLGEVHSVPLPGSTVGAGNDFRSVGTKDAVKINVTENVNDIDITAVTFPDHNTPSIFVDNDLKVFMKTLYVPVKYTIDISVRFPSLSKAKSWVQRFILPTRLGRTAMQHNFVGSYSIPKSALVMLIEMHSKASVNDPNIGDLRTWFDSHITPRKVVVSDQGAVRTSVMISDSHNGVLGGFEMDKSPDAITKNTNGTYQATVSYSLRIEKPTHLHAFYPILAYNTPIDLALIKTKVLPRLNRENIRSDRVLALSSHFSNNISGYNDAHGLQVPYYDDWDVKSFAPNCVPVMRMLLQVDPDDLGDIVNLNMLGQIGDEGDNIEINPGLLEFITPFPEAAIALYGAPLQITIFKDDSPLLPSLITIDDTLSIRADGDLDIKAVYHMVVSLMVDMRTMRSDVKESLRKNAVFFIELSDVIYPGLRETMLKDDNLKDSWHIRTDGSLSKLGFREILYRGALMYNSKMLQSINLGKNIMSFTINARSQ